MFNALQKEVYFDKLLNVTNKTFNLKFLAINLKSLKTVAI